MLEVLSVMWKRISDLSLKDELFNLFKICGGSFVIFFYKIWFILKFDISYICENLFCHLFLWQYYFYFRDRLSANDFIQIRKVQEHVYDKVLCNGSETGSTTNNNDRSSDDKADTNSIAEERVQLLCNDKVRTYIDKV